MDKEIVSLIESIQPDFSYQGTTGMINAVMESYDNMIAIDNYISSNELSSYDESASEKFKNLKNAVDRNVTAVKNSNAGIRIKKAWDFIIKSIERAIAKIKALFMTQYKKVQILYTQALEKVSALMTKLGANQNSSIDYEFDCLDAKELNKYINNYNSRNITNKLDIKTEVETNSTAQNNEDNIEGAESLIRNALAGTPGELTISEIRNLKTTLKDKCFAKFTKVEIGKTALKAYFDESVASPLKQLYKQILSNEQEVLRTINSMKNDNKHGEASIKRANKISAALQGANVKFFDAVLSVAITGMHNYIRAIVTAIKENAKNKHGEVKKTVSDKISGAAQAVKDKIGKKEPAQA